MLTFVDINPVKQAEKSLRRMSKVYTDALDPIIIVDLQGNIIDLNEEVVRMAMTAPADERPVLQDRLQRCRLMTLSLLTDERATPEAISLTI